jgi:hypothetical protein
MCKLTSDKKKYHLPEALDRCSTSESQILTHYEVTNLWTSKVIFLQEVTETFTSFNTCSTKVEKYTTGMHAQYRLYCHMYYC